MTINRFQFKARLTEDASSKQFDGRYVINFNCAINERYKNAKGEDVNEVTYVRVAYWVKSDNMVKYLKKGVEVYVEGKPKAKAWASGAEIKSQIEVTASVIDPFFNYKKDSAPSPDSSSSGASYSTPTNSSYSEPEPEDDLPF